MHETYYKGGAQRWEEAREQKEKDPVSKQLLPLQAGPTVQHSHMADPLQVLPMWSLLEPLSQLQPIFLCGPLKLSVAAAAVFNLLPGPLAGRTTWPWCKRSSQASSSSGNREYRR